METSANPHKRQSTSAVHRKTNPPRVGEKGVKGDIIESLVSLGIPNISLQSSQYLFVVVLNSYQYQ